MWCRLIGSLESETPRPHLERAGREGGDGDGEVEMERAVVTLNREGEML